MRPYLICLLFLIVFTSCKEDGIDELPKIPDEKPVLEGQMLGKIQLPEGFSVDTTGSKVVSFKSDIRVDGSTFVIDTVGKFSTLYLTNEKEDVIMMRYNYPGQKDNNISVESTALAMFMADPNIAFLSPSARTRLIDQILVNPNFASFAQEVKSTLISGKSVLDTTNIELTESLVLLFKTASNLRTKLERDLSNPIKITTQEPGAISFENNIVAISYAVGVYQRGVSSSLESFTIKGTQLLAASYSDAIAGIFEDGYSTPDSKVYSNPNDGFYEIKIRSGRIMNDRSSPEYIKAIEANLIEYIGKILFEQIPLVGFNECIETIESEIKSEALKRLDEIQNSKTPKEWLEIVLSVAGTAFDLGSETFLECSKSSEFSKTYTKFVFKSLWFVGQAMKFNEFVNYGAHARDLFRAKGEIDTCFRFLNNKIITCRWYKMVYPGPGDMQKDVSKVDKIPFYNGEKEIFDLVFDDTGLEDVNLDYSLIKVENVSNKDITVQIKHENPYFSLTLSSAKPEGGETTFDITYKGATVQTVNAELSSNVKDYTLEISTYRSDYSKVTPVFVLKPNDKVTLPNGLIEIIRLKYKGEYVKVGEYYLDAVKYYVGLNYCRPRSKVCGII